jgi:acyl-ACP thioesterase
MESIVKNPNKRFSSPKDLDNIDESEAKKIYNIVTDIRIKTHQENKRYFTNVATILSYKKILKLQIAEREFKKELFRKLRHLKGRPEDN